MIRDTPSEQQQQQHDEKHSKEAAARPSGAVHRALIYLLRALQEHDRDKTREIGFHISALDNELGADVDLAQEVDAAPLNEQPIITRPQAPAAKAPANNTADTLRQARGGRASSRFQK